MLVMRFIWIFGLASACSSPFNSTSSDNRAIIYAHTANHDAKCFDWGKHGGLIDADTAWCDVGGGQMFWCVASSVEPPKCVPSVDARPRLPEQAKQEVKSEVKPVLPASAESSVSPPSSPVHP